MAFVPKKFKNTDIIALSEIPIGFDFRYNRKWYRKLNENEAIARIVIDNPFQDFVLFEEHPFDLAAISRADFKVFMNHYRKKPRDFK